MMMCLFLRKIWMNERADDASITLEVISTLLFSYDVPSYLSFILVSPKSCDMKYGNKY